MNKKQKKELKEECKKILYSIMDKRDYFFKCLQEFENNHHFIPEKYKADIQQYNAYLEYKRIGGWRKMPGIKYILNKAAEKMAEEKEKDPFKNMTRERREKYLNRTDEIFKTIVKAKEELEKIHEKKGL